MSANSGHLVSIISFCKNRKSTIRRSLESVLGQSYARLEFVIQDGASTDGTLEILRDYAARDPRIKLVSEPNSGPAEAFWKVLHRCQGDIVGTCLSDEELLSGAIEFAVDQFVREPKLGALTCDGYNTDESGVIISDFIAGEFDFVAYLFGRYCPFWPGSFFRRKAFEDIGLDCPGWNTDSLEFEIWCRFATDHEVKYVHKPLSKYAIHSGQLSNTPRDFYEHISGRLTLIDKIFSKDGFFGEDTRKKLECKIGQLEQFHNHVRAYRLTPDEEKLGQRIDALIQELEALRAGTSSYHQRLSTSATESVRTRLQAVWDRLVGLLPRRLQTLPSMSFLWRARRQFLALGTIALTGSLPLEEARRVRDLQQYRWVRLAHWVPASLRRRLPVELKARLRSAFSRSLTIIFNLPAFLWWHASRWVFGKSAGTMLVTDDQVAAEKPLNIYPLFASIYDARGQTAQALDMWRRAEPLNDPCIDGLACQAILKLPEATYQEIAAFQHRWVDRHVKKLARDNYQFRRFDGRGKIRIGYHCSFMDGDTIRFIMRHVMAAHDRSKFEVYGYSPLPVSSDITSAFDVMRARPALDDGEFVALVRDDAINVFVEMSGFSPGHRFVAMALRCAPVQISYLNHHGTSGIPEVDYFLSDEISTPTGSDADWTFSEKIYRLPNCLLCYDYEGYFHPPVSDPPLLERGYVTFGCFGSGGKINTPLIEMWAALMHRMPGSNTTSAMDSSTHRTTAGSCWTASGAMASTRSAYGSMAAPIVFRCCAPTPTST